ncbi:MAG: DUF1329 domain-containing protein [Candidatus Dadabacteria bacterium]|nr:MAG: DUF1329 domain-containing protein [Candidatus Dadabacteria bacterium]
MKRRLSVVYSVLALLLVSALVPGVATGDVQPGDVITAANIEKVEDLVSPGLKWIIQRGMRMRIVETKHIPLPKAYVEATEKYSSQVKLSEDKKRVLNWVAGQPFPNLDPNDPDIARKIMYNYEARWGESDDLDLRNFDADTGSIGHGDEGMSVEKHFVIDHFRRMYFTGRLHVDPKPEYVPNKDKVRYKESLHPLIEPFDLKGTGFTYYRYLDPNRMDDSWLYLPQLRRVRRLSSAQRSDALFGQDTDVDSYGGYAGNIAWMDWKFLGEKTILACMHGEHFPVKWGEGAGDFAFDDVWEKRQVYVVEGISKLPQYAYSKRVIYVDKETFVIPYTDMYDQAGELWKVWVNNFRMAKEPYPGAPEDGQYDDVMPFLPSIFMVDIQLDHATRAALPSHRFEREVGWRFNMGEKSGTTEDFFSIAELMRGGR